MVKLKNNTKTKLRQAKTTWTPLIELAELRLSRMLLKQKHLEALIETMRQQEGAGEPSPMDLASLGSDAKNVLQ